MTKREIVRSAFEFNNPPYVPWNMSFTQEAATKLRKYYQVKDISTLLDNHSNRK